MSDTENERAEDAAAAPDGSDTAATPDDSAAVPVPGLFCFSCGYDLRGTGSDENCPECGLPVATSVSASMLPADGLRHGPALRKGLVMLAVSLFMIPAIPWLTIGVMAAGSHTNPLWTLSALVLLEHALWVGGVWHASEFAATRPVTLEGRESATAARAGAVVCGVGVVTTVVLLSVAVSHLGRGSTGLLGMAVAMTVVALIGWGVSLLAGSRAVAVALRALRCGSTATALRVTAIIGTAASTLLGLGTVGVGLVLLGDGAGMNFAVPAGYLLFVSVPCVWLCGLAGGVVCTVAAKKVGRQLMRLAAV